MLLKDVSSELFASCPEKVVAANIHVIDLLSNAISKLLFPPKGNVESKA